MKGYSLVEVLISLALSAVILAGLVRFGGRVGQQLVQHRKRTAVQARLGMTQAEIARLKRNLEPSFWGYFPLAANLVHASDHTHGGVQFSAPCPETPHADCLTLWDLQPGEDQPLVYAIEAAAFPEEISMSPVDDAYPRGPAETIGPMSVLLFAADSRAFCALVAETAGNEVYLAGEDQQPWELPDTLNPADYEVVHLGKLAVTHCQLRADRNGSRVMAYQPWVYEEGQWRAKRRKTSQGALRTLKWIPCRTNFPDQMLVLASAENAPVLTRPITLAGQTFAKEVFCVSVAF